MNSYVVALLALFILFNITYVLAIKDDRLCYIDITYGLGYVVLAQVLVFYHGVTWVYFFVTLWGLRLAFYLIIRTKEKAGEDPRYQAIKDSWTGNKKTKAYVRIFMFQMLLIIVMSVPYCLAIMRRPQVPDLLCYAGVALFVFGFIWEVWADHSLAAFLKNPANKGKRMMSGPWKFSRYPNYFGEITLWWGIYLASGHYLHIYAPILITVLIFKVTGIPLLEEKNKKRAENDEEYRKYYESTNLLIPRFF